MSTFKPYPSALVKDYLERGDRALDNIKLLGRRIMSPVPDIVDVVNAANTIFLVSDDAGFYWELIHPVKVRELFDMYHCSLVLQ